MSNKATKKPPIEPAPLCRVAERVFLLPTNAAGDIVGKIAKQAARQMDVSAGETAFRLYQMPAAFDARELQTVPDFGAFLDRVGLAPSGRIALLKSLFGTAMFMLRLQSDPVLMALAVSMAQTPGLPKAVIAVDMIDGYDTAVGAIPKRAGFKTGDMLISLSGDDLSVGRLEAVHDFLAWENPRERLAALSFSGEAREGRYLLVGTNGLVEVDVRIRRHADAEAFHAEHARKNPDFISLYARADDEAAIVIHRLVRQSAASPAVVEPLLGLRFELTAAIPLANGLFASGWFYDAENRIANVTAVDHDLSETDVSSAWKTFDARADVFGTERPIKRFVALLSGERKGAFPGNISLRLLLTNGESHMVTAEPVAQDLLSQRNRILDAVAGYALRADMIQDVFQPALQPIQEELNARQSVRHVKEFGPKSTRTVSLVIPLYRETGFIRSQLMAFAVDPYLSEHCEIVYVLDDPMLGVTVASLIEGFSLTFPLDLKLVVLDRNGGYAMANNMGVRQAEGETLVLMNSDVVPDRVGWVEEALEKLKMLPAASVIGPKLLYGDDSLQHAGMYFSKLSMSYWQNFHYWKGYGRHFAAANRERIVPAVTGACMIIRKDDYLAVGGFTTDYIVGDYEDSDLCLKLREKGGVPLYMPSIELYHFERQSMPLEVDERDFGSTAYNRALHTARWEDRIVGLMADAKENAADVH